MLQFTLCGISLPHICRKRAQSYGIYKVDLVMQIVKTTEIYTHITTKGFDQIISPLDMLNI